MSETEKRYFTSKDEIMAFLSIGKETFALFLKLKMPVICINGRYYGHSENIDAWFKSLTEKQRPDIKVEDTH